MTRKRGNRRVLVGEVVGDKMDKTVVVQVTRLVKHRLYQKYVKRQRKYKAHDERNEYNVGDRVQIVEGPFADLNGIFDKHLSGYQRAQVLVDVLGRLTRYEIPTEWLKQSGAG